MMLEAQSLSAQLDEKDESLQSAINELNKTRNDLKELSITVSDKDSLLKTQTLLTNSILEKRFQTLNALSKDYLTLTNQSSPRTGIVSDFKKELDIMANPESQAELERIVNNKHQGIITRLRNQLPKIKDQDIFFLTLIAAGVSRNAICLITKNKQANYYNKCSRLRRKIENSDSTDKQEFLDTIFK
jgi:predicted nuclease with TOPRIM domain